ncbi:MAG TPA: hypothetical protein VN922_22935 [Bacteroidia bacterium]|nr:hypothetical protein [Bacteroidia bacterium]
MKLYEKIYIPQIDGELEVVDIENGFEESVNVKYDVILITKEDLKEIWNKGYELGQDELLISHGNPVIGIIHPDFQTYLLSKGINITV